MSARFATNNRVPLTGEIFAIGKALLKEKVSGAFNIAPERWRINENRPALLKRRPVSSMTTALPIDA